jgi:hypothetical protein
MTRTRNQVDKSYDENKEELSAVHGDSFEMSSICLGAGDDSHILIS